MHGVNHDCIHTCVDIYPGWTEPVVNARGLVVVIPSWMVISLTISAKTAVTSSGVSNKSDLQLETIYQQLMHNIQLAVQDTSENP